jgi:predicted acetyltransferase
MIRDYDESTDLKAVARIWKECGWIDDLEQETPTVRDHLRGAKHAFVGTVDGEAECAVIGTPGRIRYLDQDLTLGAISGVTTSHIARKLGYATQLTAKLIATQAEQGCKVSALSMFEQGFYDRMGFGTGAYEQWICFDPATLKVAADFRPPKRLHIRQYEQVHTAMMNRRRHHGGVVLESPMLLKSELNSIDHAFGLGYFDGPDDTLSHCIWGSTNEGEHGPYEIRLAAWQTTPQLMELLALIRSLGDQVDLVEMVEFGEIQLQDLLAAPIIHRRTSERAKNANSSESMAFWQLRILDLQACIKAARLNTPSVSFNLDLHDPITEHLAPEQLWRGLTGHYVVSLGDNSHITTGIDNDLPTLSASVGAFSRLWLGVRPASSLAITDELTAEPNLIRTLDDSLRLPRPHLGWEF